jgi:hypothetical protein
LTTCLLVGSLPPRDAKKNLNFRDATCRLLIFCPEVSCSSSACRSSPCFASSYRVHSTTAPVCKIMLCLVHLRGTVHCIVLLCIALCFPSALCSGLLLQRTRFAPISIFFKISISLSLFYYQGWRADVQKLLLLLLATRDLAGQDPSMDPRGDMGESEQQAENRRTAGWMRCPSGWMTGRIQGRLPTSFNICNV